MKSQKVTFVAGLREGAGIGILLDIGAVPAELAELNIIAMSSSARPVNQDQFVLRTVERSHTTSVLDPYADIEKFVVDISTRQ